MTIRPARKELEYITSRIVEAIQKGQVPGVTTSDITLITDPEHLAIYDSVDLMYKTVKTGSSILEYFKKFQTQ
jgi:hypothetical protein